MKHADVATQFISLTIPFFLISKYLIALNYFHTKFEMFIYNKLYFINEELKGKSR